MLVSIHQPNLFPRLRTLKKIAQTDCLLVLEHVQFVRREWQNRIVLRAYTSPSMEVMFSFPCQVKGRFSGNISDIALKNFKHSKSKFMRQLEYLYSASPFYDEILAVAQSALKYDIKTVADLGIACLVELLNACNLDVKLLGTQQNKVLKKCDLLAWHCATIGASAYLTGRGGLKYMDTKPFRCANVEVLAFSFTPPTDDLNWDQSSCIDYIARYGCKTLRCFLTSPTQLERVI